MKREPLFLKCKKGQKQFVIQLGHFHYSKLGLTQKDCLTSSYLDIYHVPQAQGHIISASKLAFCSNPCASRLDHVQCATVSVFHNT